MQARITAARREAEGLKDRIKRKKDDLADASRKWCICLRRFTIYPSVNRNVICAVTNSFPVGSQASGTKQHRAAAENRHEAQAQPERPSGQDLCYALVNGSKASRISLARRQINHLGCLHYKQSTCHTAEIIVGHDLCICPKWQLCRLWWPGQHLLNL